MTSAAPSPRCGLSRSSIIIPVLLPVGYFFLTLLLLWLGGANRSEFFSHPDEPAHYVTGLMVHDYLVERPLRSPTAFAQDFYDHYPKVALGAWPPGFYVLQATWSLLFSPQRISMLLLMSVLSATLAWLLYRAMREDLGGIAASLGGALWLLIPLVQKHTGMIMTEIPVALFSFAAAIRFGRYFETHQPRDAVVFALLASLAILTKASALSLAFVPVVAALASGRLFLFKRPGLWASAAIVAALCGPWTILTAEYSREGWDQRSASLQYASAAVRYYPEELTQQIGRVLLGLGLIGMMARIVVPAIHGRPSGTWLAAVGLLLGVLLLHFIIPVPMEPRHLMPAMAPVVMFVVAGCVQITQWLTAIAIPAWIAGTVSFALAAGGFGLQAFKFSQKNHYGFLPVVQDALTDPAGRETIFLVSSDASGEGGFIAEVAMHERRPSHRVWRASKALASSDWAGRNYESRFKRAEDLKDLLIHNSVELVVIDESIPNERRRPHHDLLREVLAAEPRSFELIKTYPLVRGGVRTEEALRLYRIRRPDESQLPGLHPDPRSVTSAGLPR